MGKRDYSPKRKNERRNDEVSKMRDKMRNGLEQASTSKRREEYTHSSEVLDKFETSGFQPATFRTGERKKETSKEKSQNSHDSAIFGPAWKSAETRKKLEEKQEAFVEEIPMPVSKSHVPMIPDHMLSEHSETRKAQWFEYWKSTRQQLLS
ncbi:unnamed protein product [Caenorhabditis angaria]|uniref:Uncharacterized protein n=1 Tax=Caenorhabditis angaria TaxID=860376 RepID=A0A9P1N4N1_9PELO|nr:unnamed protein product [Caenorhabditis angaria]